MNEESVTTEVTEETKEQAKKRRDDTFKRAQKVVRDYFERLAREYGEAVEITSKKKKK
jgi:hypothetical protein